MIIKQTPFYKLQTRQNSYIDFLRNIKESFKASDTTLHNARNEIKTVFNDSTALVVKSFKTPNLFRKIIYTFFRPSKAEKSFQNSLAIETFVPKPIGYIEFYKHNLLNESFFVSEKFEYDFTIRTPMRDKSFPNRDEIFKAFAHFTYELHQKGIHHLDYSPGNILIKKENSSYTFKIVDINRMKFETLSTDKRLKNFNKLWADDDDLKIMITHYATLTSIDVDKAIQKALFYSNNLKRFKNFKKKIKPFFGKSS